MTATNTALSNGRSSSKIARSKNVGRTTRPLVYLKTAWMDFYSGDLKEPIKGNHRYLHKKLKPGEWVGNERFNFADRGIYNYGYAPFHNMTVNFARLGGDPDAEYMDGVDVVFIARRPKVGRVVIVGWYENARIYRELQRREASGYYLVRARVQDSHRIAPAERRFFIPITVKSGPRSPALWYGDASLEPDVRALMGGTWTPQKPSTNGSRRRADLDIVEKAATEKAAIDAAWRLYEDRGYSVKSRESEKCGWDLEASTASETLRIEVKGTAQPSFTPELTPNEYDNMKAHRASYRVVLVTEALRKPQTYEFLYSELREEWMDADGRVLTVEPRLAARLHF